MHARRAAKKQSVHVHLVVVEAVDVPRHAEVADLDGKSVADEAVAGGQVAVDEVLTGEVLGAGGHLSADVHQLPQREHRLQPSRVFVALDRQ